MTDSETTGSQPYDEDADLIQQQPDEPALTEEPGYLTRTGEAVGEDGSVVPVIGGLPVVEGSAWDIGAAADDRGADPADGEESAPK